jgi:hypothetical protein
VAPRFRNFGTPAASDEPIIFQIYEEEFKCRPSIQGRTLIELVSQADQADMAKAAGAILTFMDRVLVPSSRERFQEMTESDDRIVDMDTLSAVMEWLIEQYAGRPTEESSDSSDGPTTIGPLPMDGQYLPVSSSSNLMPVTSST